MKILGRLSLGAAALATLLGALAGPARAHEKWFVGEPVGGLRAAAHLLGGEIGGVAWCGHGGLQVWGRSWAPAPYSGAIGTCSKRRLQTL